MHIRMKVRSERECEYIRNCARPLIRSWQYRLSESVMADKYGSSHKAATAAATSSSAQSSKWDYDTETETRPRRDVQNNVSRHSVETFKPWPQLQLYITCKPIHSCEFVSMLSQCVFLQRRWFQLSLYTLCPNKKHVTTFCTITLRTSARLQ